MKIAGTIYGTLNNDKDMDRSWTLEVAIPFENFSKATKRLPPKPNDLWYLNVNRHGGKTNARYSQWAPTLAAANTFGAPAYFGDVIFSGETTPTKR